MSLEKDMNGNGNANTAESSHPIELALTPVPPQKYTSLSPEAHALVVHDLAGATYPTNPNSTQTDQLDFGRKPPGTLYATIIKHRQHLKYKHMLLSAFYNVALILQILFGAVITALSGSKVSNQVALTILAAANTVNAGILALMFNSGMPDRMKNDLGEFEKVEQHVRALIETGVIKEGWSREDVVADCWERYMQARAAIGRNKPTYYKGSNADKPIVGPGKV